MSIGVGRGGGPSGSACRRPGSDPAGPRRSRRPPPARHRPPPAVSPGPGTPLELQCSTPPPPPSMSPAASPPAASYFCWQKGIQEGARPQPVYLSHKRLAIEKESKWDVQTAPCLDSGGCGKGNSKLLWLPYKNAHFGYDVLVHFAVLTAVGILQTPARTGCWVSPWQILTAWALSFEASSLFPHVLRAV